jgi:hypothetical protein
MPIVFVAHPHATIFERRIKKLGFPYVMLPMMPSFEYNRLLELADVSIDPPDWSGGNTSIKAAAMGTPVVALPGSFMRGRHTYAFHKIAGLESLIAANEDDYIDLIADKDRLADAMRSANPDALYGDTGVVRALDEFILAALAARG